MNKQQVFAVLTAMGSKMEEHKAYLTELDNAIADGDHGINMARGFAAAKEKLPALADKDIGTVLKTVGMTLVSVVAGSAGPLYGTAFMKSGMVMAGKEEMDTGDLLACLKASVEGIMMRGKATRGEKTMLDAMIPAQEAIGQALAAGQTAKEAIAAGVQAGWDGVEFTKTIAATKGRASYIGERSIGHADPGAVSFTYLLEAVLEAL